MKRLLLISAVAIAAGTVAAAPAVAGLAGNPSFSHQIPVRVPEKALQPTLVDDHGVDATTSAATPTATPKAIHTEPGDDNGVDATVTSTATVTPRPTATHVESGDDNGVDATSAQHSATTTRTRTPESGDDNGVDATSAQHSATTTRTRTLEPGDDNGSHSATSTAVPAPIATTDDLGHHGGGSDSGHGGSDG